MAMLDPDFQKWAKKQDLKSGKASDKYMKWAAGFQLDPNQLSYITGFVLKKTSYCMDECYVGGVWMFDDSTIPTCPDSGKALQQGLLLIGNSGNGDYLAANLRSSSKDIGFVSHDMLWSPTPPTVRNCFSCLDVGFGSYLELLDQGHEINDYHSTKTYLAQQQQQHP